MDGNRTSRRRFISGSAAVPVVLTVQSGSAVAATSSGCQLRDNAKPMPTLGLLPLPPTQSSSAPSPDEWVRMNIQLVTIAINGTPYQDTLGRTVFFRNFNGSGYFAFIDATTTPATVGGPGAPVPGGVGVVETNVPNGIRSALVQVNSSGAVVGFIWDTGLGGQKITKSCWTSFK